MKFLNKGMWEKKVELRLRAVIFNISITWEFTRNMSDQTHSKPAESKALGLGPRDVCFHEPSGIFGIFGCLKVVFIF